MSSSSSLILFARGVIARLELWPALRLAVDESWGGPDSSAKRTWVASVLVDAFESEVPKPDVGYVEETLLQVMEDEFDVMLEDGSAEGVARDIVQLWKDVGEEGNSLPVEVLEEQVTKLKGKKVTTDVVDGVVETDSEGEEGDGVDSDEDEEMAPPLVDRGAPRQKPPPEVDDDGFTLVKGKGTSRR